MLLTNAIILMALAVTHVTSAAIADTKELVAFRGDRLSVMPKGPRVAEGAPHVDCEYSGVVPGVWYTGVS